jgi:uncharacterized protein YbjT (DUF2867 family)
MADTPDRVIVVTGATGHQGGAVTRHLLRAGWYVRALTRNVSSSSARELGRLGAEVVQGDMGDPATLRPHVAGAYGIYSVQNPMISGLDAEIHQGTNVAEVASEAGVKHLVYGSAGTGEPGTGIGSWESKLTIEGHMRSLGLPVTVLRPMALMELMTDQVYYPPDLDVAHNAAAHGLLPPGGMARVRRPRRDCRQDLRRSITLHRAGAETYQRCPND